MFSVCVGQFSLRRTSLPWQYVAWSFMYVCPTNILMGGCTYVGVGKHITSVYKIRLPRNFLRRGAHVRQVFVRSFWIGPFRVKNVRTSLTRSIQNC